MTIMRFRLPSPWALAAALAIVGTFPAIRAPFAALSLDTKLGTGLYVVSMIVLGILGILADRQATAAATNREADRERAAADRETVAVARHDAFVALQEQSIAISTAHRDEDRARSQEDRTRLEAMMEKFGRGLAAEARRETLVATGRSRGDPVITALAHDASGAWHDVVQMYASRQRYQAGTAAQLAAAAQLQKSLDEGDTPPPGKPES